MTTEENITIIKINGNDYPLQKSALEKMSIYQVLTDCETDTMPELTWEISPANIVVALRAIHDNACGDLSQHIEITKFLRYLGVNDNIFENYVFNAISGSVIDYFAECKNNPYDDIMIHIFDAHPNWYLISPENLSDPYDKSEQFIYEKCSISLEKHFAKFITTIICEHFPINFQKKVVTRIVKQEIPTWHLWCITWSMRDLFACFGCQLRNEKLVDIVNERLAENIWPTVSESNTIIDLLTQDIVEQLLSHDNTK